MRIFFIVDEFPFFLPEYLDATIQGLKGRHKIVGITPLVTPKNQKTLYTYIRGQAFHLGVENVAKLALESMKLSIGKMAFTLGFNKSPRTILQVALKNSIPVINTTNVNDNKYLEKLKRKDIDIIVSSCSQIFKKDILSLPNVACINRHSAYLPSYGGLFPVFYAMIRNEKYVGATVHRMVKEVDGGSIISQVKTPVKRSDTLFSLYKKTYEESVNVTIDAINKLEKNKKYKLAPTVKTSYFSFPNNNDWKIFWKKGKRII